jgi:hypothetical protein
MAETPMSDEERRLLAHLTIPRTLEDLSVRLALDPHVEQQGLQEALDHAISSEWIVNLGSYDEPAKVVKAVASSSESIDFGKGQAKIWQNRAENGLYGDTMEGDFYMLSVTGLEALQGDDSDPEPTVPVRRVVPANITVLSAGGEGK